MSEHDRVRFHTYSAYLKRRYGVKTYRVSVDAGFSCPNRKGGRTTAGCVYCDVEGSRAPYLDREENLSRQISGAVDFLARRYDAKAFSLYFQAYSGTHGSTAELRRIYNAGLSQYDFRELIVATRPDCVDAQRADLLSSYLDKVDDVWVELGLQSPNDETLARIGRGHDLAAFERAFHLLRSRGIKVGVHLLFGLPGEGLSDVRYSAEYIDRLAPDGVKIHNLRIVNDTPLFRLACKGEVALLGRHRYVRYLATFLPRLRESTVILRLGFDPPRGRVVLPSSFCDKTTLYNAVNRRMAAEGTRQGSLVGRPISPHERQA